MPSDSQSALVSVERVASVLRGYAFGSRQPAIQLVMQVRKDAFCSYESFDRAVAGSMESLRYDPPVSASGSLRTVESVVRLAIGMLVLSRVGASSRYAILPMPPAAGDVDRFLVAFGCSRPQPVAPALQWACEVFCALADPARSDDEFDLDDSVFSASRVASQLAEGGVNAYHFLWAADELDIPVFRVIDRIFQFGIGARRRLLDNAATDRTLAMANLLTTNKTMTATILRRHGLPGSPQVLVRNSAEAEDAARKFGFPVVVKPMATDQGKAVSANLQDAAEVRDAFEAAHVHGPLVIVEPHFEGDEFRMTVFEGDVIKVEKRVPTGVDGDGTSTVTELVAAKAATARFRRAERVEGVTLLALDDEALHLLKRMGLSPDSVPAAGQRVTLRHRANASGGADQILVPPEDVHPDNLALAVRASEIFLLDFAGIDFLIPDVARSWKEIGALICEVNLKPGIGASTTPHLHRDVIATMFRDGARIPVYLLVSEDNASPPAALLDSICARFSCNGLATADGLRIDGAWLQDRPPTSFDAAQLLLADTRITGALCVMSGATIARNGLPHDRFDAILLDDPGAQTRRILDGIRPHTSRLAKLQTDA